MDRFITTFEDLTLELIEGLKAADRTELVEDLQNASISKVTFDDLADAGYIYLKSSRPLNIVEQNIIGIHSGETISVECKYWVNLDIDNFNRLCGIEILTPPIDLKASLKKYRGAI